MGAVAVYSFHMNFQRYSKIIQKYLGNGSGDSTSREIGEEIEGFVGHGCLLRWLL